MKWRQPADRKVVEAVIATFRDPAEESKQRLSAIREHDWARSSYWLDASGLALYFPQQLLILGIEDVVPEPIWTRLQQNLADNRVRVAAMFAEFAAINQDFQAAGVDYANLKGFTVSPESCPDPSLRRALDLDFLVDGSHLAICREILADRGYILFAATSKTWEFKAGSSELADIKDFYKAGPQRSVELHFSSTSVSTLIKPTPSRDERLDRLVMRSWGGISFPALSPAEQFIGQALHLLGHLCSASTRPSWVLEYRNHVTSYFSDQCFWENVKELAREQQDAPVAIGLASLLSTRLFGGETPRSLDEWTLDRLSHPVRLWAEYYGPSTVLADFPGTKLYLLLLQELCVGEHARQARRQKRRRLLPAPRVPRIIYAESGDSLRTRFRKELVQVRFILFRLRFHFVEGLRYFIEATRWRRRLQIFRHAAEKKPYRATHNPSHAEDCNS